MVSGNVFYMTQEIGNACGTVRDWFLLLGVGGGMYVRCVIGFYFWGEGWGMYVSSRGCWLGGPWYGERVTLSADPISSTKFKPPTQIGLLHALGNNREMLHFGACVHYPAPNLPSIHTSLS